MFRVVHERLLNRHLVRLIPMPNDKIIKDNLSILGSFTELGASTFVSDIAYVNLLTAE